MRIEPATVAPDGSSTVRCRVKNTGAIAGDEVVQLYVCDVLASVARRVMELAGFQRVHLQADEEQEVAFSLGCEHVRMHDRNLRWVVEPGTFRLMVGASSSDILLR